MKIKVLWIDGIEQEFEILYNVAGIKEYYVRQNAIDFVGKFIPDKNKEKEITIPLFNVRWIEIIKDV